jgi:hypothetical protein
MAQPAPVSALFFIVSAVIGGALIIGGTIVGSII